MLSSQGMLNGVKETSGITVLGHIGKSPRLEQPLSSLPPCTVLQWSPPKATPLMENGTLSNVLPTLSTQGRATADGTGQQLARSPTVMTHLFWSYLLMLFQSSFHIESFGLGPRTSVSNMPSLAQERWSKPTPNLVDGKCG